MDAEELKKQKDKADQRLFNEAIALQLIEDFTQIADLYHFMVKIVQETVSPDH